MKFIACNRGCFWKGPDGRTRNCYPIVLSFQVDYPEACLLTLVRQNQACPSCMARKHDFSNLREKHRDRTVQEMTQIFNLARNWEKENKAKAEEILQDNGLVNVKVHGSLFNIS